MTRPAPARERQLSTPAVTASVAIVCVVGFVILAWWLVDPAPPDRITIATGPENGYYQRLGERFRWGLSRYGVEAELVPTTGTPANLERLAEGSVDAAFIQGGVGPPPSADTTLRAIATLSIEPLWLFSRTDTTLTDFLAADRIRIAAGIENSGTRDLVRRLIRFVGIEDRAELVDLAGQEAADALVRGDVDVAAFVTASATPWVDGLLRDPDINIVETRNLAAIVRRLPFVKQIDLPQRIIDFAGNIPPQDKTLFGVSTALIVSGDLHPAIKQVLLQVSERATRGDRLLGTYGQFPSPNYTEYPIDPEAQRFFTYGPTLLRRYLPFWAANLFERFWVLAIPIATLLIPIVRFGPTTFDWSIRRRIFRHYRELREIEAAGSNGDDEMRRMALEDLDRMEEGLRALVVPLGFRDDLYRLRMQVSFVREQLNLLADIERTAQNPGEAPPA